MITIKVRLYPNKTQSQLLNNHFGCCRFVYNNSLAHKRDLYLNSKQKISKFDLVNRLLELKNEFDWLKNVKAEVVQNSLDNLDLAFKGFFKGKGYPKFKNKKSKQSFVQKQNFKITENNIIFLKHQIKYKCSDRDKQRLINNKIKRISYIKDNLDNYYASILLDYNEVQILPKNNHEVGIDLGLKHFLITSDGEFVDNPKFLRHTEKKLIKQQRFLSRKKKGSNNRNKQRIKVAKIYKKITNQREYFLHQVSNKIINENQVINLETLSIKNMMKNHKLAKSIQDASWGKFISMLLYKSVKTGRELYQINRFAPSSKTCSNCGWIDKELTLADRTFNCDRCGHVEDRDINAAKNILKISRDELTRINASGQQAVATE